MVNRAVCAKMSNNTTQSIPANALQQQFIVICVMVVMAIILLLVIFVIFISAVLNRCRRQRQEEVGLECRVFLTEQGGSIIGTILTGPRSQTGSPYSPRTGLGYEDMSPGGRAGESIYETVQ